MVASMSCTVCPPDTKCPHIKQSTFHSIFKNGKMKKPPEDDDVLTSVECTSGDANVARPPGFVKYLKRCFKLRLWGNTSRKHRSKTVKASEPAKAVSSVAEVNCVNFSVDSVNIPSTPSTIPSNPANIPPEPLSPTVHLVNSTQNAATSSDPVISPTPDNTATYPSKPDTNEPNHSGIASTVNNSQKSLAVELLNLSKYGWYWGPITQAEAVEKLLDQPDGSFLVRDSHADHFLVSMSFKTLGRIYHTRINHNNGHFFFYTSPEHTCASIHELIEMSMDSSKSSIFCYSRPSSPFSPSLPIRLTRPVSRFTEVRSLQHLCRFVIRQYTRIDQIKELPLPNKLCGYLEDKQF